MGKDHQDVLSAKNEVKSSDYMTPECLNFVARVDVCLCM